MTKLIFCTLLFIGCTTTNAQEHAASKLMIADSLWGIEHFTLPTGFAQEMSVSGFEEAFFPKGWGTVAHDEFWSYVFTWSVKAEAPSTVKELESNLTLYFDGLLNISQPDTTVTKLPSTVLVIETKKNTAYTGKLRIFDNFRTKKMITLHMQAKQYYCQKEQRAVIVFRFSPKPLHHEVWEKLYSVVPREDVCTASE